MRYSYSLQFDQVEEDKGEGEPKVFSLVPSNYPVVLPNGESTLSDKVFSITL